MYKQKRNYDKSISSIINGRNKIPDFINLDLNMHGISCYDFLKMKDELNVPKIML